MEIKKYDKIKIINPGKLYSTYRFMAEKMQLQYFEYGYQQGVVKGLTGKVIAIDNHYDTNERIYGVRLDFIKRDIIMGRGGVTLFCKMKDILELDDSLFEL